MESYALPVKMLSPQKLLRRKSPGGQKAGAFSVSTPQLPERRTTTLEGEDFRAGRVLNAWSCAAVPG
jgi:hypothetical protein